ncbi:hypothetical protein ZTR_04980 [Talaromyces verruculosus]|nr:hypothetical protein ZTR_04980 [Talaromyces verruculosus]
MICQRCRTSLLSRIPIQQHAIRTPSSCISLAIHKPQARFASTDTPKTPAMPPPPAPRQPGAASISIPSAISSATPGVSQPLSTPTDGIQQPPKWVNPGKEAATAAGAGADAVAAAPTHEPSSCVAGTPLTGLNYMKGKPDIVALEDHEYPDWLWTLLDDSAKKSSDAGGVDVASLNKKQRKRYEKKMAALAATQPRKIPLHEQATDITPAEYNTEQDGPRDIIAEAAAGLEKTEEITKSAREARRKGIRESNFLRGL